MGCLKGRPALITTPIKMYSKQDTRNKAVFSEFLMFDLSGLTCGGMNLWWPVSTRSRRNGRFHLPWLLPHKQKAGCLNENAEDNVPQQRDQNLTGHKIRCRPLAAQYRSRTRPAHWQEVSADLQAWNINLYLLNMAIGRMSRTSM